MSDKPKIARDHAGKFLPGASANPATMWKPGQEGGGRSRSKLRRAFEEKFFDALTDTGSPEEAAELLWRAARKSEPWALTLLLSKIAPTPAEIHLRHSREENDERQLDYTKLTDAELDQLGKLLEKAEPLVLTAGAGEKESS